MVGAPHARSCPDRGTALEKPGSVDALLFSDASDSRGTLSGVFMKANAPATAHSATPKGCSLMRLCDTKQEHEVSSKAGSAGTPWMMQFCG